MSDQPTSPHPSWYDPGVDFDRPHYLFACRIGAGAAAVSSAEWRELEPTIAGLWLVVAGGLTWEEARPAVYHGWLLARATPPIGPG